MSSSGIACACCGTPTPEMDLMHAEQGAICLACHAEQEADQAEIVGTSAALWGPPTQAVLGMLAAFLSFLPMAGPAFSVIGVALGAVAIRDGARLRAYGTGAAWAALAASISLGLFDIGLALRGFWLYFMAWTAG